MREGEATNQFVDGIGRAVSLQRVRSCSRSVWKGGLICARRLWFFSLIRMHVATPGLILHCVSSSSHLTYVMLKTSDRADSCVVETAVCSRTY